MKICFIAILLLSHFASAQTPVGTASGVAGSAGVAAGSDAVDPTLRNGHDLDPKLRPPSKKTGASKSDSGHSDSSRKNLEHGEESPITNPSQQSGPPPTH